MFKYIGMPKLVALYLREFSLRKDGETSVLFKFIFCLCLPFISRTFRKARLIALAIAECTNSQDQIVRLLEKITGVTVVIVPEYSDYNVQYDGTDEVPEFSYDGTSDTPVISYNLVANAGGLNITLNGASQTEVEGYVSLLIPFYIALHVNYIQ